MFDGVSNFELFSPTFDNRFVFSLFDLLLCGVIVLVLGRAWRSRSQTLSGRQPMLLFLAFSSLGASFALGALSAGAYFFFQERVSESTVDALTHILHSCAWFFLAASAYPHSRAQPNRPDGVRARLVFGPAGLLFLGVAPAWDVVNVILISAALVFFRRRRLGGSHIATAGLALFLLATLFHLASSDPPNAQSHSIFWNLEQFTWVIALFTFALAIGETSGELFDKVFVRLQIAFILLASMMMLVITQTEKREYLVSIQGRSQQLADFVSAHVDYFQRRSMSLPAAVEQEDFLQRLTQGFATLPELKLVRIVEGLQMATFEIASTGRIDRGLETLTPVHGPGLLDPEEYFPIHLFSASNGSTEVQFYGTREFLNRHIRKRIVLIFSLFTAMVALSTLMIGMVVGAAGATIRQQAGEIEASQRKLMQASKLAAIGELAAGVAHEINNPATTIMTRASFLLSQKMGDDVAGESEDLRTIVSQGQRIAEITRGLLTFSRPPALDPTSVPVDRVIQGGLQGVRSLLKTNRVTLEIDVGSDLPRILADERSLARALENIFRNAADAMPGKGILRIAAAEETTGRLRVEVSDTGTGIPQEHLGRIFDPFFTTKEVGQGTGLGLSIAHGIIQEHNGTIAVESAPGMGTRFTIVLPAES